MANPADFLALFGEDEGAARAQAQALAEAMGRRRAAGTVASIIGGPFARAGQAFLGDAGQTESDLFRVGALRGRGQATPAAERFVAVPEGGYAVSSRTGQTVPIPKVERKTLIRPPAAPKPEKDMGPASTDALRKEWQATDPFKKTQEVATAAQKILSASESGPGDLSLLYGYMKILDPGSTVREGEFAQAAQTGNLPERIQGWASKVISGEKLPKEVRDQFRREAKAVVRAQKVQYDAMANRYREIAKSRGLNPDDVVFDLGLDALSADEAPASGSPSKVRRFNPETGKLE